MYSDIETKRDGGVLDPERIGRIVQGYTDGKIPDYQMSAMLMAIFIRGMNTAELTAWTRAMINSGEVLCFSGQGPYLDKHSTGGVGDKVSLPLAPVLAELGIHVPMISGRGLGHTGGTLDKLESIPGFRTDLEVPVFKRIVDESGCCIIGQTASLAPADKKLYALRDVTATVASIPLIASSILSKKAAAGISGLLMDVKVGSGAFMRAFKDARKLAETLVALGGGLGLRVKALITDMNQVLGRTAGNALEVIETIEVLKGSGPADVVALVEEFAAQMAVLAQVAETVEEGREKARLTISSGAALARFGRMVEAQGGDAGIIDDSGRLPQAPLSRVFPSRRDGFLQKEDCARIGQAVVALGGGRRRLEDKVDPAVGLVMKARLGQRLSAGQPLAMIHYRNEETLPEVEEWLKSAFVIGDEMPDVPPLIHDVL
jgi:pyrimidine-nucleoside phosphorylase